MHKTLNKIDKELTIFQHRPLGHISCGLAIGKKDFRVWYRLQIPNRQKNKKDTTIF